MQVGISDPSNPKFVDTNFGLGSLGRVLTNYSQVNSGAPTSAFAW